MLQKEALIIAFPDATAAEANRLAGTLADTLRDTDPTVVVQRIRNRADTQDLGASLALVLGTAAVTAIAKGIAAWLARNSGAKMTIRCRGKVVIIEHADSKDLPRIVAAISSQE